MDMHQLEYVLSIAENGNLSKAAEKLFISPSALSQHISKLEGELHTPLFERNRRVWRLTYAGTVYVNAAQEILKIRKNALSRISDIAENKTGHFTVGITLGRGTETFSAVFPQFKKVYNNINIGLFEGNVLEICEKISAGEVDIGFLTSGHVYPNVKSRLLLKEEILLALPKTHLLAPLAEKAPEGGFAELDVRELKDEEFLLAGKETTLRVLENRIFEKAGFTPKIAFETPSLLTLEILSKSGFGPSFLPRFYVSKTPDAVFFRLCPRAYWDLVVSYAADRYLTNAQEYLISLVKDFYNASQNN